MRNVVLYIAASIDGYIARKNGALDWLENLPNPDNTDHGYLDFLSDVDAIVMGRKTYNELIGFDIEWPYKGINSYIISSNTNLNILSPDTFLLNTDIEDFIKKLKLTGEKSIWLVGGGQLVSYFLNQNLIDKIILSVAPVILGEGIALFDSKTLETQWELENVEKFNTGIVSLTYTKK